MDIHEKKIQIHVYVVYYHISNYLFTTILLFYRKKTYSIPIYFDIFPDKPIVNVEIENNKYSLLVDIGASNDLGIQQMILDKIKKKIFVEHGKIMNGKGAIYDIRKFSIPFIKIKNLICKNLVVQEEDLNMTTNSGLLWTSISSKKRIEKNISSIHGKIGRSFFSKWVCIFDFPHFNIILSKNIDTLLHKYSFQNFVKLPFFINECGIIVSLETDLGMKNFLMDTGATTSLFRTSLVDKSLAKEIYPQQWNFISNKLQFENYNFGHWNFWLYEFCHQAQFDGVLGIDFFKSHIVVFDFENNMLYIHRELTTEK